MQLATIRTYWTSTYYGNPVSGGHMAPAAGVHAHAERLAECAMLVAQLLW